MKLPRTIAVCIWSGFALSLAWDNAALAASFGDGTYTTPQSLGSGESGILSASGSINPLTSNPAATALVAATGAASISLNSSGIITGGTNSSGPTRTGGTGILVNGAGAYNFTFGTGARVLGGSGGSGGTSPDGAFGGIGIDLENTGLAGTIAGSPAVFGGAGGAGNSGGAGGQGGTALVIGTSAVPANLAATFTGGNGGTGGLDQNGGNGGAGVLFGLVNFGTLTLGTGAIQGGNGGAQGSGTITSQSSISASAGGTGVDASKASFTNLILSGPVQGGNGASGNPSSNDLVSVGIGHGGAGGIGVIAAAVSSTLTVNAVQGGNGANGAMAGGGAGNGGRGGAGGQALQIQSTNALVVNGAVTGGAGGVGGNLPAGDTGAAGAGANGGAAISANGTIRSITVNADVTGGAGGAGGNGVTGGSAGQGGSGSDAIFAFNASLTINVGAHVTGGAAGPSGTGGTAASTSQFAGRGVVFGNVGGVGATLINNGVITVGGASGATPASNALEIRGDIVNAPITIVNNGTITGGSVAAINTSTDKFPLSLTLSATSTTGDILLGTGPNSVTLTTGAAFGNITGGAPSPAFTLVGGVAVPNLASGSIAFNLGGSATGSFDWAKINGAYSITKSGSGTWTILGADQGHNGGTIITAGTLQVGNGGTSGSLAGDVTDNAALVLNRSDSLTVAGAISGTGTLTQGGAGTTILSGTSTYTGPTTVASGTLNISGSIASSAVTVASGASLTGTGTAGNATISAGGILAPGNSAGAVGTLSVNGNLSLASTATTNVDVSPAAADKITATGTAAIGGTLNATFASGTYSATQYALVTSNGALSGTFANYNVIGLPTNFSSALSYDANNAFLNLSEVSVFSSATTTNVNSGTVTVSGNQTTGGLASSGTAGTIAPSSGAPPADNQSGNTITGGLVSSGSGGTIALASGATLTDNQSGNTTYSGIITGAGNFAKAGTGTLILNGVNTYTGLTTISGGVLKVGDAANPAASINGPVTIGSGGTLSGHGTINGPVTVGAGGNFQPGGTIGTINVASTTFASGSTYTVETSAAGQGNNTLATGTIAINSGTTLAVTPDAPLTSYGRLTNYTILQAAGGISGTFSSVTSTAATLTPVVAYAPNTVTLTLVRPDLLATVATTTNQASIGTAIVASGSSAILSLLAPQSDAAVRIAFNQLSGDIHASLRSAAVEDSRIIRDTVLDHLGKTSGSMTVWGAGFGGYGSISTDGNASGLHHDMAGFIAGADVPLDQGFRLGLAGAYTSNNASVTGKTSTASGNSGHIVAYGGWSDGKLDLKAGGDFGFGNVQVTRTLAAFSQTNNDRQSQRMAQVFGEAGFKFETSRAMVEPFVGLANVWVTTGSFAETGGSTALSGGSRTETQTYSTVGLRALLASMSLGESVGAITPHVDMGWQHAFNTLRPGQVETIAGLSQSFTVLGAPLASDAAAVRAGFDMAITPEAVLSLDYDGSFASRVQNNAVRGSLAWRF